MKKYDVLNSNESEEEIVIVLNTENDLKLLADSLDISVEIIKRTNESYIVRHQKDIGSYGMLSNGQSSLNTLKKLSNKIDDRGSIIDFYIRLQGQVV